MERSLVTRITSYLSDQKRRKIFYWLLVSLGAIVVFITTYILILPAVTLSNEPICGVEAHVHDETCWTPAERQLVCEEWSEADMVVHTHNRLCYNGKGKRVCPLAEYELHVHDNSCYVEMQTMVCGHEDEEMAEPEMILVPGHTHTDACYNLQRGDLTCGQEEASGHSHSNSCYTVIDEETGEEELTCGQAETRGHTHDDSCYDWGKVLTCGEEESEGTWMEDPEPPAMTVSGHIHTDDCYEIEKEMICFEEELQLHTHTESCYDLATGVMTCEKPEIIRHVHNDSCFAEVSDENLTLSCGQEEHEHTDDCYLIRKKDPDPHRCGLSEHTHTEDCYFESGEMRCTIPEHTHTEECLDAGNFEKPEYDYGFDEKPDEASGGELGEASGGELSGEPDRELGEEPIEKCRRLLDEDGNPVLDENGKPIWVDANGYLVETDEDGNPVLDEDGNPVLVLDEDGNPILAAAENDVTGENDITFDDFIYSLETEDFDVTLHITGVVPVTEETGEASEPASGGEPAEAEEDGADAQPAEAETVSENKTAHVTAEDVEFRLERVDVNKNKDAQALLDQAQELTGEESTQLMFRVLQIKARAGGQELDLTQCEVTVEMQPKPALVTQLAAEAQAQAAENLDSANTDEEAPVTAVSFALLSSEGVQANESVGVEDASSPVFPVSDIPVLSFTKPQGSSDNLIATIGYGNRGPYFTVEYYAKIAQVVRDGSGTLSVIDTDSKETNGEGGNLPKNGETPSTTTLTLGSSGKIVTKTNTVQIYENGKFYYADAPSLNYFNIFASLTARNTNYEPTEVWIKYTKDIDLSEFTKDQWKTYTYSEWTGGSLHFTNRKETSEADPNYILIRDDTVIRLVCEQTTGDKSYTTNFHDYDINSVNLSGKTSGTMQTGAAGINSDGNYKDSGAKLAFGNVNTGVKYGRELTSETSGSLLNMHNSTKNGAAAAGYEGCTFGLASSTSQNGQIDFTVDAPNLFSTATDRRTGRYDYTGSLTFRREGDTYTLTKAFVNEKELLNLDTFNNPKYGTKTYTNIWTNNFWPMDKTWNNDIHFGSKAGVDAGNQKFTGYKWNNDSSSFTMTAMTASTTAKLPASDDGENHNSFFGMDFAVDFEITDDYVGPLEYYFFGDDDMWVYLTDSSGNSQLVCDIGGVHSSVGEYVNLWNWISQGTGGKYKLNFYYTERGASGSTCWMQFTLPSASVATTTQPTTGLTIKKEVDGAGSEVNTDEEFEFKIYLWEVDETGQKVPLMDDYNYVRYDKDGNKVDDAFLLDREELLSNGETFYLKAGEEIRIEWLPEGVYYQIVETPKDGYIPTYSSTGTVTGNGLTEFKLKGNDVLTITNHVTYKLPETGGSGYAMMYATGEAVLFLLACGLLYNKKFRRKGGCQ